MSVYLTARPNIVIPGVLDSSTDEAHITLGYIPETPDDERTAQDIHKVLSDQIMPRSIESWITGYACWGRTESRDYHLVALVGSMANQLMSFRASVVRATALVTEVDTTFPYNPHITISSGSDPFTSVPALEENTGFVINNLFVSTDENRYQVW
ncbi:2'-5' RNA ligase family protein [Rhodococcus qingshengii]|uniref:2'-5' RNA ligase family protein n=1 Tax=Rhodococcus qingshengii TaxID=334542 RepID=UPI0035E0464D